MFHVKQEGKFVAHNKKTLWVVILALSILMLIIPATKGVFKGKESSTSKDIILLKEIEVPHSSQINYKKFQEGLIQYWDGVLFSYSSSGQQNWSLHLGVVNPIIKVNLDNVYVFDQSKNQLIRINNKGEVVYRTVIEKPLSSLQVCSNNYVLINHERIDNSPINYLLILNEEGKITGEISLNSGDIINTTISQKASRVVLHTLELQAGNLVKSLLIYDLKGNLIRLDSIEDILLSMHYNNDKLVGIIKDSIISWGKNGEELWSVNTQMIKNINVLSEENIVIFEGNNEKTGLIQGRSSENIKVLNYNGNIIGERGIKVNIAGIDVGKEKILYYTDRTVFILNDRGQLKMEYKYNSDIEQAYVFPQNYFTIVTKEKISFFKTQEK